MARVSLTEINQFINSIGPMIQAEARARGYHVASPIIAQACVESRFGKSGLSAKYHNYFGLKAGSAWKGPSVNLKTKEEYKVGTLTTIKDNFRVYSSMALGVKGYFDFINTKRYANLKTATTPQQYLEYIKADGYATSSTYVQTNMSYISKYGLTRFDSFDGVVKYDTMRETIKIGSRGSDVLYLQQKLISGGYPVGSADGIFGPKTHAAVVEFQREHKLSTDGIVGPKTWEAIG